MQEKGQFSVENIGRAAMYKAGQGMEWIGSREMPPKVWKTGMLLTLAVTTATFGIELNQAAQIQLLNSSMDYTAMVPLFKEAQQASTLSAIAFGALMCEVGTINIGIWNHGGTESFERSPLVFSTLLKDTGKLLQDSSHKIYTLPPV